MADIAARREARKRKILENSESRLLRISGQINNDTATNIDDKKCNKTNLPSLLMDLNTNGVIQSESMINSSWDDEIDIENDIIQSDFQCNFRMTKRYNHTNDNNIYNDNEIIHGQDHSQYNDDALQYIARNHDNQKQNITLSDVNDEHNIDEQLSSIITKIIVKPSIYIFLAAIMNVMLILKWQHLYGTSIIIPFLLISMSRLWIDDKLINDNQHNGRGYSMIIAALILCNVRPNIIYSLKKLFNIANQLINDLAIFIFSFVLIYYIVSRYIVDIHDISLSNTDKMPPLSVDHSA